MYTIINTTGSVPNWPVLPGIQQRYSVYWFPGKLNVSQQGKESMASLNILTTTTSIHYYITYSTNGVGVSSHYKAIWVGVYTHPIVTTANVCICSIYKEHCQLPSVSQGHRTGTVLFLKIVGGGRQNTWKWATFFNGGEFLRHLRKPWGIYTPISCWNSPGRGCMSGEVHRSSERQSLKSSRTLVSSIGSCTREMTAADHIQ